MASPVRPSLLLFFFSACLVSHGSSSSTKDAISKLYIVYMGDKHHEDPNIVTELHHDTLVSVLGSKGAALQALIYSYRHGFSGFAAMLSDSQAMRVAEQPGVLRVKTSGNLRLHTTRSWDFLRLSYNEPPALLSRSNAGDGVIVGVIDTGIWPESRSFDDKGYGPIPQRWKGTCQTGESFNSSSCNLKIIGARFYPAGIDQEILDADYQSPRDGVGHGTHVASTIAGSYVENASFHGVAAGVARGGAPMARLAVYKVIWGNETGNTGTDASLLKAIDDAINDGVDVLSLSLALTEGSWATLRAVMRGISVVYSAGNDGPTPQIVENVAPWVLTVAASSVDRSFPTPITLGNNRTVVGQALYYRELKIYDVFHGIVDGESCDTGTLNETEVARKYILCTTGTNPPATQFPIAAKTVLAAKGIGIIFAQYPRNSLIGLPIPVVFVDFEIHQQILDYITRESSPMAKVSPTWSTQGKEVLAPVVATFSSRGPSKIFPGVLKPDIAAPGVNILAAKKDSYELSSGTSMAAPHVSAAIALIKAVHPNWSPAVIKSALITTASVTDAYGLPIMAEGAPRKTADPFDFGGGNIDPNRAVDPGLVYDINPKDYEEFHCTWTDVLLCQSPERPVYHLNLPSISIPDLKGDVTVWRSVINVGPVNSVYKAFVEPPPGVEMFVEPSTLVFNQNIYKNTFKVTFRVARRVQGVYTFGSLTWYNERHRVRIPVAARVVILDSFAESG